MDVGDSSVNLGNLLFGAEKALHMMVFTCKCGGKTLTSAMKNKD